MRSNLILRLFIDLPRSVLESGNMIPNVLLASNSPRRKQLLALTGWQFTVQPVDIDESWRPGELPQDYVLRLAKSKAQAAASLAQPGQLVLAADTTVADGLAVLGKPASRDEARAMLGALRGRGHWVYTAIAALDPASGQMATDVCGTQVWMRAYSDAEMDAYIASGDPFDKAGAYAIQHQEFHPVERIEGCYACVVGLAICRVVNTLRVFGYSPLNDVTSGCQSGLGDACSVFPEGFGGQGSAANKE